MDRPSGELRPIEIKGLARLGDEAVLLSRTSGACPGQKGLQSAVRGDNCAEKLELLEPIRDPAQFLWHEVRQMQHYYMAIDALKRSLGVRKSRGGPR